MRRVILIGLPTLVVLLLAAAVWYRLSWHGDALQMARLRMKNGDMQGAEIYLRQAIRERPNDAEAAFRLGQVDLALGNPSGAELELRRARDRGYDAGEIIQPLGQAMLQQHHGEQVLREFDATTAPPAQGARIMALRASAQLELGDIAAAAATSATAEQAQPKDRDVLLTAAKIAMARGDMAGVTARADRILADEPEQLDALLLKSEVALRGRDAQTALADAQRALAASPKRLDARLAKARALAALGREDEARTTIEEVVRAAPRDPSANYLRLILALHHNDYQAADASLAVLSPILGSVPRGLFLLAVTKLGVGQPAQAEEAVTKFLGQNPDDPEGRRLMALIDLARQKPADALQLLRGAVESGHADSDTLDLYARAQGLTGDMQGASRSLAKAAVLAPSDAGILNRLAAAKLNLGQTDAAEADLRHSLAIKPAQPGASEALIQASLAKGDFAAARAELDQMRAAGGDTEASGVLSAQANIAAYDLDGAETQLRALLKRFPESQAATLTLVQVAALRGNQEAGEVMLEDWLHRHPGDETALSLAVSSLIASNHADRAVKVAEAAHEAAAANPRITAALAGAYVRANQAPRALALLDRAAASGDAGLELLRAQILMTSGHKQEARQAYAGVLEHAPGSILARRNLAALQIEANETDAARATLTDGLHAAPGSAQLMGALVGLDLKTGGIKAALATAATLQQDSRNLPAAASLPGDAWLAAHDPARAAAAYQEAFRTTPSAALAAQASFALTQAGQPAAAIALMDGWVAAHPDDLGSQSRLAGLLLSANRLDEAAGHLKVVLQSRPGDADALNNLAWISMQKGDMTDATSLARRAYVRSPTAAIADTLGWILAKQNDSVHALPLLAQGAASTAPDQAARRYHYAYALNEAGRAAEARPLLQQALADPAPFDGRDDAKKLQATLAH